MNLAENARPWIVGLTGGIGTGKTTVSRLFAAQGVEVIDADEISRALVVPGSAALTALVAHFGADLCDADGSLRRTRLRELIFADPGAKAFVEGLLHPLIRSAILERIRLSRSNWLLLVVPLLLENDAYAFVDRVLVTDLPEAIQKARTAGRDHTTAEAVSKIIASQLSRAARLAAADDVFDNSGSLQRLDQQVMQLCKKYEESAHDRHQKS